MLLQLRGRSTSTIESSDSGERKKDGRVGKSDDEVYRKAKDKKSVSLTWADTMGN